MLTLVALAALVVLALVLLGVARWGWRLLRENEEPLAGGSMSEQMAGPRGDKPPDPVSGNDTPKIAR